MSGFKVSLARGRHKIEFVLVKYQLTLLESPSLESRKEYVNIKWYISLKFTFMVSLLPQKGLSLPQKFRKGLSGNLLMVLDPVFWYQPPHPFTSHPSNVWFGGSVVPLRRNDIHSLSLVIEFPSDNAHFSHLASHHHIWENNFFDVSIKIKTDVLREAIDRILTSSTAKDDPSLEAINLVGFWGEVVAPVRWETGIFRRYIFLEYAILLCVRSISFVRDLELQQCKLPRC
jgi:hypothetical protein